MLLDNKLKNRDGEPDKKVPLFFNGAIDFVNELPRADDTVNIRKVYAHIDKLELMKKEKQIKKE